jgi:hypothetical protein
MGIVFEFHRTFQTITSKERCSLEEPGQSIFTPKFLSTVPQILQVTTGQFRVIDLFMTHYFITFFTHFQVSTGL